MDPLAHRQPELLLSALEPHLILVLYQAASAVAMSVAGWSDRWSLQQAELHQFGSGGSFVNVAAYLLEISQAPPLFLTHR